MKYKLTIELEYETEDAHYANQAAAEWMELKAELLRKYGTKEMGILYTNGDVRIEEIE